MNNTIEYLKEMIEKKDISAVSEYLDNIVLNEETIKAFISSQNPQMIELLSQSIQNRIIIIKIDLVPLLLNNNITFKKDYYNELIWESIRLKNNQTTILILDFIKNNHLGLDLQKIFENLCLFGNLEVIKALVENEPNILSQFEEGLTKALQYSHFEVVQYLIEKGIEIKDKKNAFLCACGTGNLEILKCLIQQGVDFKDPDGFIEACKYEKLNIIKFLVENGIDVQFKNNHGLKWAAYRGNKEVAQYLIEHGANIYDNKSIYSTSKFIKFFQNINFFKSFHTYDIDKLISPLCPLEISIKILNNPSYLDNKNKSAEVEGTLEKLRETIQYLYSQHEDKEKAQKIIKEKNHDEKINTLIHFIELSNKLDNHSSHQPLVKKHKI